MDKKILSIVQTDLAVAERPFDVLAQRLGATVQNVMDRIARLHRAGVIRRLGPVFDSRSLGYDSTLVAARVPAERLDEVAGLVSGLPGVTHNYRREHAYNLWFTLTSTSMKSIEDIIENLRNETGIPDFFSLPALTRYKIRVDFALGEEHCPDATVRAPVPMGAVPIDEDQKALVRLLQEGLPVVREPFARTADELAWTTRRVLDQIADWRASGVIRRFGAVVNHRRLGFLANGMAVFEVGGDKIDQVGAALAEYPEISHCYRRPVLPDWQYDLFAMVHGKSLGDVRRFVDLMASRHGLTNYDVLFAAAEYKKTSMRYFV